MAGLLSTAAGARPILPVAQYNAVAEDATTLSAPGSISGSGCGAAGCQTSSATVGAGEAMASGSSSFIGTGGAQTIAGALFTEYFEVYDRADPSSTAVIPLIITGRSTSTATGSGAVTASAGILYAGLTFQTCASTVVGNCLASEPGSARLDRAFNVYADSQAVEQVNASGSSGQYQCCGSVSFAASADHPRIVIDPVFRANNPQYRLVFSPLLPASAAATPEPATWALMLTGFGMIGAGARAGRDRKIHARKRSPGEMITP